MLNATITVHGTTYTNLLHTVVSTRGLQLPEGTTHWGLRAVWVDEPTGERSSSHGFSYPTPGNWAEAPGPIVDGNDSACPRVPGDGLCLATTDIDSNLRPRYSPRYLDKEADIQMWSGIASGGIPADHLLLVAYDRRDVLGVDYYNGKIRIRKMFVVADVDGADLIRTHGTGAELSGLDLHALDDAGVQLLMAGATYADLTMAKAHNLSLYEYARVVKAGARPSEVLTAAAEGMNLHSYILGRINGYAHAELRDAHRLGLAGYAYIQARDAGISHERIIAAHRRGFNVYAYYQARQAGASDRRVRAARRAGLDLNAYASALRAGTRHREALAVHRAGLNLEFYAAARTVATHTEACEAVIASGRFIGDYVSFRQDGERHEQAIVPHPTVTEWEQAAS